METHINAQYATAKYRLLKCKRCNKYENRENLKAEDISFKSTWEGHVFV